MTDRTRLVRLGVAVGGVGAAALLLVVGTNTRHWIGTTFPGFFIVSNRVVPSIALPGWSDGNPSRLFQHQVVAVDGAPLGSATAIYEYVARQRPGSPLRYTLRAPDGSTFSATVPCRRFSGSDYVLLFGAYLLCGGAFLATGLLVVFLKPRSPASLGLLSSGLVSGVFVTTAADLYGPHWFVRLHLVGESLLAPAILHLALVFPTERLRRYRRRILLGLYVAFAVLAVVYEIVLASSSAYTTVHLIASAAHGGAAATLIAVAGYDLLTSPSALVRRRITLVAFGILAGLLIPAVTMAASALLGGSVALNAGALTAALFPLSLGYAIVKHDLFEIDVLLRRATTYGIVILSIAGLYLAVFAVLGLFVPGSVAGQSPAMLAVLNLAFLFLIAPVQTRVQYAVDRLFFRKGYEAEEALSGLSQTLASAHTLDEVVLRTRRTLDETLRPVSAAVLDWQPGGLLRSTAVARDGDREEVALPPALAARAERGELLARYEWDDGSGRPLPPIWHALHADLLIPISSSGLPIAALALGAKGSGRPYTADDVTFLRAAASQVALAMTNARAFAQLEELNAGLERMVAERTAALETANAELNRSLDELRSAYQRLERNQASLMRADRLATLGRLTAGIAHEVNTPLGATLNALTVLTDLGREYAASIADPTVTADDHRQIARELLATAEAATTWTRKAGAFINKVKTHGREPRSGVAGPFELRAVVTETQALLAHRLHASSCHLDVAGDADARLVGEPMRLGQVLVNLVTNAIDAYEDARVLDGRIEVRVRNPPGTIILTVRDWAGGIPPEVLPRIFDELFTTKEPGRGTGLGLWIARNLIEQSFGGTLTVDTEAGVGSCFTVTLPVSESQEAAPSGTSTTASGRRGAHAATNPP